MPGDGETAADITSGLAKVSFTLHDKEVFYATAATRSTVSSSVFIDQPAPEKSSLRGTFLPNRVRYERYIVKMFTAYEKEFRESISSPQCKVSIVGATTGALIIGTLHILRNMKRGGLLDAESTIWLNNLLDHPSIQACLIPTFIENVLGMFSSLRLSEDSEECISYPCLPMDMKLTRGTTPTVDQFDNWTASTCIPLFFACLRTSSRRSGRDFTPKPPHGNQAAPLAHAIALDAIEVDNTVVPFAVEQFESPHLPASVINVLIPELKEFSQCSELVNKRSVDKLKKVSLSYDVESFNIYYRGQDDAALTDICDNNTGPVFSLFDDEMSFDDIAACVEQLSVFSRNVKSNTSYWKVPLESNARQMFTPLYTKAETALGLEEPRVSINNYFQRKFEIAQTKICRVIQNAHAGNVMLAAETWPAAYQRWMSNNATRATLLEWFRTHTDQDFNSPFFYVLSIEELTHATYNNVIAPRNDGPPDNDAAAAGRDLPTIGQQLNQGRTLAIEILREVKKDKLDLILIPNRTPQSYNTMNAHEALSSMVSNRVHEVHHLAMLNCPPFGLKNNCRIPGPIKTVTGLYTGTKSGHVFSMDHEARLDEPSRYLSVSATRHSKLKNHYYHVIYNKRISLMRSVVTDAYIRGCPLESRKPSGPPSSSK